VTGRHERCSVCGTGRLYVFASDEFDKIVDCANPDCPTHAPTGPIPVTNADRAAAEVDSIKRELRARLERGER
jgi:hypothetical protein